jgi:hypothetical protein
MIGNDTGMPMSMPESVPINNPMEVIENKVSREVEPGVPEWTGDPRIHVIIIPGRGIVRHDRRAFSVVIIIDHRGGHVLSLCRGWAFSVFLWHFSNDR